LQKIILFCVAVSILFYETKNVTQKRMFHRGIDIGGVFVTRNGVNRFILGFGCWNYLVPLILLLCMLVVCLCQVVSVVFVSSSLYVCRGGVCVCVCVCVYASWCMFIYSLHVCAVPYILWCMFIYSHCVFTLSTRYRCLAVTYCICMVYVRGRH